MKKKILVIHHRDVFSGAEKVLVDTLASWNTDVVFSHVVPRDSRLAERLKANNLNTVSSSYLSGFSEVSLWTYFKNYILFTYELLVLRRSHDVLVANTFYASVRCWLFALLTINGKCKKISILHDIFLSRRSKIFLRVVLWPFNGVIAVSKATVILNGLTRMKKVEVIYNGIELAPMSTPKKLNRDIVAIVGLLDPWKGQLNLLKKMMDYESPRLLFIGSDFNKVYTRQLKEIGNTRCEILGEVSHPWRYALNRGVNFSINCSVRPDPLPTVVLESIASGIIPFVTNLGGAREMIPSELWPLLVVDFSQEQAIRDMKNNIDTMTIDEYINVMGQLHQHIEKNFSLETKRNKFQKFIN